MGLFDFLGGLGDIFSSGGGEAVEQLAGPVAEAAGSAASSAPGIGSALSDVASTIGSGASSVGSALGSAIGGFGDFAKKIAPVAQLGATGFGIASNIKAQQQAGENAKSIKRAIETQERAAVPLTNFGEAQLKNAQAGNIPPAVQAQIDNWVQAAKLKVRDYLARTGNPDSTAALQWDQYIEQQAKAMQAQALTAEGQQGIEALSRGASAASGVGQQAGQQQSSLENLIAMANKEIARIAGGAS